MDAEELSLPGLVPLGWITALLLPPIGFILGIVIVTRPDPRIARRGTLVIAASIVITAAEALIGAALIIHGANNAV